MVTNKFQKEKCPKCKKQEGLELIYGAPTREEAERIKRGLAKPGGLRPESGPVFKWNCGNCGYVWGSA
jgi:hypothetical protein